MQHDTNLNLIKMHVFPMIVIANNGSSGADGSGSDSVVKSSPEYLVISSTLTTFKSLVQQKVQSWR